MKLKRTVIFGDMVMLISSAIWIIYTIKWQNFPELIFNVLYAVSAIIISVLNIYILVNKDVK
jgi:hypothetical protein